MPFASVSQVFPPFAAPQQIALGLEVDQGIVRKSGE